MTQEHKELLLKDLCSRLPYRLKVKIISRESKNRIVYLTEDNICHLTNGWWSECKPYLFPLSSMTEEQHLELLRTCFGGNASFPTLASYDWLNKNHFDYRGLIDKGLAIDATNKNIY